MTSQTVRSNKKGFTLIELLAAMVITLVGLLGLLQAFSMVMQQNLGNNIRNEAVRIGQQVIHETQEKDYSNIVPGPQAQQVISRNVRGGTVNFTVNSMVTQMQNSMQVDVTVNWTYKTNPYTHVVSTIIGNNQ